MITTPPTQSAIVADRAAAQHKSRTRPINSLILGAIVLIAAIVVGTAIAIYDLHDRALAHTKRELANTASILAAKTDNILEIIERVQVNLSEQIQARGVTSSDDFERKMSGYDIHLMLKDKILGVSHVSAFTLVNAQGKVFNFSRFWPAPNIDVSDRDFFKAIQSVGWRTFFISDPIQNRATGTWVIQFARKITAPNGELAGLFLAAIELQQFEKDFQSIALGESSSISLLRSNGVLVARFPRLESAIGRSFATATSSQLEGREHVTVRLVGQDNKDRVLAAYRLARYPFYISVGRDVATVLSDWQQEVRLLVGLALFAALLIAVGTFVIVRQLLQGKRTFQQTLDEKTLQLDSAVENMSQGMLMFDSFKRLIFCNRRYITMYGLSPDVVKPGCTFYELIRHRKETGSFVGDIEQYCTEHDDYLSQGKPVAFIKDTSDGRAIHIINQPIANGGWVATHEDVTERKRSDERIAHLAHYDALTDLPNRVLFREQLEQSLKRVHRGERLAVIYLDIDLFKIVNDTFGHPVGDELLKVVAARLRSCIRDTDFVARLGGDEFAIIQGAVMDPKDVIDLVTRIHEAIREPFEAGGHQLVADTSIGIALAPDDGTNPDQLLKNADLAMYGAKSAGRGTYHLFEPIMDARLKARRALEFDLRDAIMCGGLELYYQPVVNLRDNSIVGCEALLRWRHSERGMVSPIEFIPIAEETGLITPLGEWALRTACVEAASWPDDIKVAVNVSPVQFKRGNFVQTVISALAASRLPACRLELEITEAVLVHDDETVLAVLHQLRGLGVRIAMDDFGTGYSSLSYLHRFPFDKIKIDRSFIKDVAEQDGSLSIVQAVVNIATARNITTTAEGVETEPQLELLRTLGCTEMQGYLFSRPIPVAELTQLFLPLRGKAISVA